MFQHDTGHTNKSAKKRAGCVPSSDVDGNVSVSQVEEWNPFYHILSFLGYNLTKTRELTSPVEFGAQTCSSGLPVLDCTRSPSQCFFRTFTSQDCELGTAQEQGTNRPTRSLAFGNPFSRCLEATHRDLELITV